MRFPHIVRHAVGVASLFAALAGLGFAAGWMSGDAPRVHAIDNAPTRTVASHAPVVWKPPAEIAPRVGEAR